MESRGRVACPVCLGPIRSGQAHIDARAGRVVTAQPCGHTMPDDFACMLIQHLGLRVPPVTGAALVTAERRRQAVEEGFDPAADVGREDLAWMAWALADRAIHGKLDDPAVPLMWPEDRPWRPGKTPIRALTIAAALLAAEIDRRLAKGERP